MTDKTYRDIEIETWNAQKERDEVKCKCGKEMEFLGDSAGYEIYWCTCGRAVTEEVEHATKKMVLDWHEPDTPKPECPYCRTVHEKEHHWLLEGMEPQKPPEKETEK